ncbi:MAG: DUF11 domain-containing protein, partial [Methanobrevibacter ruminantium]|uniref:DUF11 domain-containing protein n=1 Tax=Methanobrevibacter ruminantium TaxID=83816 RepID=UPI0026EC1A7A
NQTVPVVDGSASVDWTVPSDFAAGNYTVNVTYNGNGVYSPSENSTDANISALNTTTVADPVVGKPGATVPVDVTVVDENGKPVVSGNVTVALPDGTNQTVPVVDGSASVDWTVPEDYVGDYAVDVTYNGNDVYNPSSGNGAITVIPIIDLEINISVDRNVVNYGDVVEFIITVRNNGPSDASEVTATNVIPNGFVYLADNCSDANYQTIKSDLLGSSASSQSYDSSGDVWFIGDLAKGEEVKLSILARVNYVGNKSVSTSVIAYENESTYVNNNDSVSVTVMPIVDLELVKTVDKTKVIKGNKVTYTFTVTNRGPNDATGVKVTDSLITKHQFVSASSDGYDYETGIWNIGDLANGSSVTLTVTVIISEPGDYSNSASVSSDQEDTNESNNYASSDNVTASDVPDNETEDEPEVPDEPKKVVSTLPEAGNPILMVLLALFFALLPLKRRR